MSWRRLGLDATVATVSLAVALVVVEVVLRWVDRPVLERAGWYNDYEVEQSNELGYRGWPIEYGPSDEVVLLVGDSQVEARACSYANMPERRLEVYLRQLTGRSIRVFSVGASGYGQDQEWLAMRRFLDRYSARHVVTWLTLTNDVKDNTWPTHMPVNGRAKPTFWLDGGELRGPNVALDAPLPSAIRLVALVRRLQPRRPDHEWAERRLPEAYRPRESWDGPVRTEWHHFYSGGGGAPRSLVAEKSDRALMLTPPSARTLYGLALTQVLLERMWKEAESRGASFTVFGIDKGDRGPDVDGVYVVGGRYFEASSAQYWSNIERVVEGLPYRLFPVRVSPWKVSATDHHLNERATDDVMRQLAEYMTERLFARRAG